MKGWIRLHRQTQEHWIWSNEKHLKWWLAILLNVNYEAKKFPVGCEFFVCNPGQSFRSIEQWTDMFSCSKPSTIKFFNMLKKDGMILTETVGKGNRRKHLLTVINWEKYQEKETETFTETFTETVPLTRIIKNEKNEKNINIVYSKLIETFHELCPDLPKVQKMTESSKKAVQRIAEKYGKSTIGEVLHKTGESDFLSGRSGSFTANFDWIFKPQNFVKVLEGNYRNKTAKTAKNGQIEIQSPVKNYEGWE